MIRTRLLITTLAMVLGFLTTTVPLFGADQEKVLYNFGLNADGEVPMASLVFDKAGNLYGTTNGGGGWECDYTHQASH